MSVKSVWIEWTGNKPHVGTPAGYVLNNDGEDEDIQELYELLYSLDMGILLPYELITLRWFCENYLPVDYRFREDLSA